MTAMNAPETALLRELRDGWGGAYSITVEDGVWRAYPSYGPVRDPIEAASARALQRKLRHKTSYHIGPDESGSLMST